MPNSLICLDASLLVRLVLPPTDDALTEQWATWERSHQLLVAPTLLYYEVTNALHQYHRHGYLSAAAIQSAQEVLLSLGIRLYGDRLLHELAMQLAQTLALPATYDAHYVALAQRMGAALWTADRRLFNSVQPHFADIHLWSGA